MVSSDCPHSILAKFQKKLRTYDIINLPYVQLLRVDYYDRTVALLSVRSRRTR